MSFVKNTFAAIGVATVSVLAIGMIAGDKITQALENARQKCDEHDEDEDWADDDWADDDEEYDYDAEDCDCDADACVACSSRDICPFWENDWEALRHVIANANEEELTEIIAMVDSARVDLEVAHQKEENIGSMRSDLQAAAKKVDALEKATEKQEQPTTNEKNGEPTDNIVQPTTTAVSEVKKN